MTSRHSNSNTQHPSPFCGAAVSIPQEPAKGKHPRLCRGCLFAFLVVSAVVAVPIARAMVPSAGGDPRRAAPIAHAAAVAPAAQVGRAVMGMGAPGGAAQIGRAHV